MTIWSALATLAPQIRSGSLPHSSEAWGPKYAGNRMRFVHSHNRHVKRHVADDVVRSYYARVASTYDETFARVVTPATDRLTQELRVQPSDHVLDLCCGTGSSAVALAAAKTPEGRVVGVDASVEMLDRARGKARDVGADIDLVCENVIEFIGRCHPATFDVVTLRFALTYFDWHTLVPQLPALLKPGGRLGIVTSTSDSLAQVQALYRRFVRSPETAVRLFGHTGMSLRESWEIFQQIRAHFSRPSFIRVPNTMGDVEGLLRADHLQRLVSWHEVRTEWHPTGLDLVHWLVRSGCIAETAVEGLSEGAFDFIRTLFAEALDRSQGVGGVALDFRLGGIVVKRLE